MSIRLRRRQPQDKPDGEPVGRLPHAEPALTPAEKGENVSYATRQNKRAELAADWAARNARAENAGERHWLTLVRKECHCENRGGKLRPGSEFVYRLEPRQTLCIKCADGLGIYYEPSMAWEKARRRGGRNRRSAAPSGRWSCSRQELVAELVIEAANTPRGAWTRRQLAAWDVEWPPPKGWRRRLVRRWSAPSPAAEAEAAVGQG